MNDSILTDSPPVVTEVKCYHCAQTCEETLWADDKPFCCYGCKTVYEILSVNDLCEYYSIDKNPGIQLTKLSDDDAFAYLDEPVIRKKVVEFDSADFSRVR